MHKNILILEDDIAQANCLHKFIKNYSDNINVNIVSNLKDAEKKLLETTTTFDIFLLDISTEKTQINNEGFLFAKYIQTIERYKKTPILFLTAYPEYIYPAVNELHCYAYLLKPYSEKDVHYQLTSIFQSLQIFSLKTIENIYVRFPIDTLLYVESHGRYLTYVTKAASYISREYTLKELENELPNNFIRCHKSFIMNQTYIERFDHKEHFVFLNGVDEPIPLRRTFYPKLNC